MSRVRAPYPTPLVGGSGITPGPPRLSHFGMSPSGKAQDFDSCIRAFEPRHPSQCGLALPARRSDSVAQQAEQLPFKQWVRGSNPRRVTKEAHTHLGMCFFAVGDSNISLEQSCGLFMTGGWTPVTPYAVPCTAAPNPRRVTKTLKALGLSGFLSCFAIITRPTA